MSSPSPIQNKLLAILPPEDYEQFAAHLEYVDLPQGTPLGKRHEKIEHIYFLTSGMGSVVVSSPEGQKAEAGLFGREGFIPTSAAVGSELSVHDTGMQLNGTGFRIKFADLRMLQMENRNIALLMARAIEAFAAQLAYTALSNAVHDNTERLARWLLMSHDRSSDDEIHLTHEFMSLMLATRRSGVTTSLHVLEGNGFIRAQRGLITIRNRKAMEDFAHDAYGRAEEEYKRLMDGLFQQNRPSETEMMV